MSEHEVFSVPLSLVPSTHLFENIANIWSHGSGNAAAPFGRMLLNSLVMALVIAIGKIAISMLSAYAIVFFRFPFRNLAFWLIFITLMLPVEVRIFPTCRSCRRCICSNTYAGLTLPLIASATATFLFRQFFMTLPDELMEAARIDGAGAVAVLLGHGVAAVEDEHRGAVRDHVHLWLEPVSVADADHQRAVAANGGGRHQEHDRVGRHRDRMASGDDRDAARDAAAARGRADDAALVRARPGRAEK